MANNFYTVKTDPVANRVGQPATTKSTVTGFSKTGTGIANYLYKISVHGVRRYEAARCQCIGAHVDPQSPNWDAANDPHPFETCERAACECGAWLTRTGDWLLCLRCKREYSGSTGQRRYMDNNADPDTVDDCLVVDMYRASFRDVNDDGYVNAENATVARIRLTFGAGRRRR